MLDEVEAGIKNAVVEFVKSISGSFSSMRLLFVLLFGGSFNEFWRQHVIRSKAENWADMPVTIKAGEVIYLKQEVEVGVMMARNSLKVLSNVEGRYLVKV
nr:hypothetical protein [Pseudomonas sp. Fl4BN1]